jgi:hypothetical protein
VRFPMNGSLRKALYLLDWCRPVSKGSDDATTDVRPTHRQVLTAARFNRHRWVVHRFRGRRSDRRSQHEE